jgi:hypothetical protein
MILNKPLPLSEADIERISQISEIDFAAGRGFWRASVPGRWRTLPDSQTIGIDRKLSSRFVWDGVSRRYIELRSRRYVPYKEIRDQALESMIKAAKLSGRAIGRTLQETGDLAGWERAMLEHVKTTQIAAALVTQGGPEAMSEKDKKKTAAEIAILLLLLRKFSYDIDSRRQPINGRLLLRSDLYSAAARGIFEETRRYGMGAYFGAVEERRVLGRAEHCESDEELEGCVELADKGWKPIGTLPRLGVSPCRSNCYCRFDYRYKDERGRWVEVDDSATVAKILQQRGIKESIDE